MRVQAGRELEKLRERLLAGDDLVLAAEVGLLAQRICQALTNDYGKPLERVLNATGILLHTNLGARPAAGANRGIAAGFAGCLLRSRVRARIGTAPRSKPSCGPAAGSCDRSECSIGGQQQRCGNGSGSGRSGCRSGGDRLPWRVGRDRRFLSDSRIARGRRRTLGRGRHYQPHAPGRLRGPLSVPKPRCC